MEKNIKKIQNNKNILLNNNNLNDNMKINY